MFKNNLVLRCLSVQNRCFLSQTNIWSRNISEQVADRPVNPNKQQKPVFLKRICGWQIHGYGGLEELQLEENIRFPRITDPKEVIVRVSAASINPIDIAMMGGYGSKLFNLMRKFDIEFPLTLGRDFCGEIVSKGMNSDFKLGDRVWGVIPVQHQGCHSQFVTAHSDHITTAPRDLKDGEAASILYAGLTAWSGLFISGQLSSNCQKSNPTKRVLILGGSGGVGNAAIQICKAENCETFATASKDAENLLKSIGVDSFLDYNDPELDYKIKSLEPFDIILDCAGLGTDYANKITWKFKDYITFSSPLLRNFDSEGMVSGAFKSLSDLIQANCQKNSNKSCQGLVKWGYFIPSNSGIKYLKDLVERKQYVPVIHKEVKFREGIKGYEMVKNGHLRGKVVLTDFE